MPSQHYRSLHIGHALISRFRTSSPHEDVRKRDPGFGNRPRLHSHACQDRGNVEPEGTSRWELGREEFLRRAWEWKDKYGHIITDQVKSLGASCDWSGRFTMDEGCSKAVAEVFVRLYEKGLIYKETTW